MRTPLRQTFLFLAASSTALACSSSDTIEITFDPCSSLTIVPGPNTEDSEVQSVADAIELWGRFLPTQVEVGSASGNGPELNISFESGDTFYRALYMDGLGEIVINRDRLASDELAMAIAHEMGHAFGLFHVPGDVRPSVMNQGNLVVEPNLEDATAVAQLWEACGTAQPQGS